MKVMKTRQSARIPSFTTIESFCFDIKACLELNDRLKTFNPVNRETEIQVKTINGKNSIQIHPDFRVLVPTGLVFVIPEKHTMKIYSHPDVSIRQGIVLTNDLDFVLNSNKELFIAIRNSSDNVVFISDEDNIARAKLEKMVSFSIEEILDLPQS